MKLKLVLILSLFLGIVSCKKREYPKESTQLEKEKIYFDGVVDNEPISLKIGTNNYYCYSSYNQRTDCVYVFTGELKKFDCNPCPQSLRVELSDYKPRLLGASVPVDSVFSKGSRGFMPSVSKANTIRFVAQSNMETSSIRWDLSNGESSQGSVFNTEFTQRGPQTVSLTIRTKSNCESMVVNTVFVDERTIFACDIKTEPMQNNTSKFETTIIGGKAPYRYTWNFGDGSSSTLPAPNHDFKWIGSYPVKLKIEDADNRVCESNYVHIVGNDKSSCAANMSLSNTSSRSVFLTGVKIQWTDQSNTVLSSGNITQPSASYFEITNSQSYVPNERGEAGQLLSLRLNVLLSDGKRKVWLKSENAVIAVTYK